MLIFYSECFIIIKVTLSEVIVDIREVIIRNALTGIIPSILAWWLHKKKSLKKGREGK